MPFKPPGHWKLDSCCYCGAPSEHKDHVPPLEWMEALGVDWFHSKGITPVWVPACAECNLLLSATKIFTVAERTHYLLDKYRCRYAKLMKSPKWLKAELEELTGRTKDAITEWQQFRTGLTRRLAILGENKAVRPVPKEVQAKEVVAEVLPAFVQICMVPKRTENRSQTAERKLEGDDEFIRRIVRVR